MNGRFANVWPRRATKRRRRGVDQGSVTERAVRALGFEPLEGRALLTAAVTITWTGAGANANWSTPGNWDLGRAPINGDSLVFPATAQQLANNDDIPGLSVNSITFRGTFATPNGGYTLSTARQTPVARRSGRPNWPRESTKRTCWPISSGHRSMFAMPVDWRKDGSMRFIATFSGVPPTPRGLPSGPSR